jgi:hypothetical protein
VLHDDFREGLLDTQIGDPGGELPFQGQRYRTNSADLYVGHERAGNHRLGLHFRPLSTTYLPPLVAPYFNEQSWSLIGDGEWHVGPLSWVLWEASGGAATLDRPATSTTPADERTEREASLRGGAGWELSGNAVFQFLIGPARQAYEAQVPSTFRGLIGSVAVASTAPTGPRWSVDVNRDAFASVFGDNNYFVSNQVTVRAESARDATVKFGGSTAYYRNDYPTDPGHRLDRTWGLEAWMGIRQGVWVQWRVYVRYDLRSSTLAGADYSAFRIGAGVVVGR